MIAYGRAAKYPNDRKVDLREAAEKVILNAHHEKDAAIMAAIYRCANRTDTESKTWKAWQVFCETAANEYQERNLSNG